MDIKWFTPAFIIQVCFVCIQEGKGGAAQHDVIDNIWGNENTTPQGMHY